MTCFIYFCFSNFFQACTSSPGGPVQTHTDPRQRQLGRWGRGRGLWMGACNRTLVCMEGEIRSLLLHKRHEIISLHLGTVESRSFCICFTAEVNFCGRLAKLRNFKDSCVKICTTFYRWLNIFDIKKQNTWMLWSKCLVSFCIFIKIIACQIDKSALYHFYQIQTIKCIVLFKISVSDQSQQCVRTSINMWIPLQLFYPTVFLTQMWLFLNI